MAISWSLSNAASRAFEVRKLPAPVADRTEACGKLLVDALTRSSTDLAMLHESASVPDDYSILVQLAYTVWFSERPKTGWFDLPGGRIDGLTWQVTLDRQGRPWVSDSIHAFDQGGVGSNLRRVDSRYRLIDEDRLRALRADDGSIRSRYGPDGLVAGTERGERFLFERYFEMLQ